VKDAPQRKITKGTCEYKTSVILVTEV